MLDKAVEVDQSTIEETERLLRDRLPTIFAELKLPTDYRSQKALREYQAEESRLHHLSAPAQKMEELKAELWQKVSDSALAAELLSAVRAKIGDFGYSASRVLFELFQNADDAYRQHDGPARTPVSVSSRCRTALVDFVSSIGAGPSIIWDVTPKRDVVSVMTATCSICC